MSTKVYFGWRCLLKDFSRALNLLQDRVAANVEKTLSVYSTDDLIYKNPKDIVEVFGEAGFHVFLDQGSTPPRAYFIGYFHDRWAPKRLPKWIEPYSYWNNTDQPKSISRARWEARGKTWDRVAFDGGRWERRMIAPVFDSFRVFLFRVKIAQSRRADKSTSSSRS